VLDDARVDALAERLGIGARHLSCMTNEIPSKAAM